MKNFNKSSKNSGFSLVELIAVIAVMVILAGVAVPIYGSYTESAAQAADATYINEAYRAAAVVAAQDGTTLVAVGFTLGGEVIVSHASNVDESDGNITYKFCTGCSTEIVAIIGGMQDFQSSTLTNAAPTSGDIFETSIGTLVWCDAGEFMMGAGTTYELDEGAWILVVEGDAADWTEIGATDDTTEIA